MAGGVVLFVVVLLLMMSVLANRDKMISDDRALLEVDWGRPIFASGNQDWLAVLLECIIRRLRETLVRVLDCVLNCVLNCKLHISVC